MASSISTALLLTIPLAPLAGALIAGLAGKQSGTRGAHTVTILGVLVAFVLSAGLIIFFTYFYTSIIFNPIDLAENLKKFVCEWVQIDDGWQGRGTGVGSNRDWFVTSEKDFPRGMKPVGDECRKLGIRFLMWYEPERVVGDVFTRMAGEIPQRADPFWRHAAAPQE